MLAAVGAFLYLYRTDGHMAEFHSWHGEGEVQEAAYEPDDHADVLRLAAEAEGDASALVAAYWPDRQPEAFRIYRATQTEETVAFSARLRLTDATGEDADPVVVAATWSHARSMAPLHLGEHIAVARFSVHPAHYQRRSPVMDLIQWRAMGEIFRADHLAWSYLLMRDGKFWIPHMVHFDVLPIPPRPSVGEHGYTLFAHDWRAQPVVRWLDQKTRAMFAGPQVRHPELVVLSRPEFDASVREALRGLLRRDALDLNPLARSRLVAEYDLDLREVIVRPSRHCAWNGEARSITRPSGPPS